MCKEKEKNSNTTVHYTATGESQIVEQETINFIAGCQDLMNERSCTVGLISAINNGIELQNSIRQKKDKFKKQKDLIPYSIAMLIASRGDVALIGEGDSSQTGKLKQYSIKEKNKLPIGYYQTDGFNKGVWETDNTPDNNFSVLAEKYKPTITQKEKKEAFGYLKNMLSVIPKCVVPYYVAVDNGIYDVVNKKLFDFSPDIVFTSKIHTTLNLQATNPHIPIPEENNALWNVDDWLNSLGTPSFVGSIKEVIQAACMPLVPRNKMVLFFSISGNSGKGTICELIRNLLGKEVVANIPIKDFSAPFGLSNLPDSLAVVTDENNVNDYIKELGVIKSVITGDVVTINQKYEKPYDFQYKGLVLQCVNEFPNVADKSGSFRRRLHIIPFSKCFTGVEQKFIKERLIYREDVLEYILKMVLVDMPYRTYFTETKETRDALAEYEYVTNSVVSFLDEVLPMARWNLLPATELLYEAYKKWYCKVSPSGKILGRNDFIASVKEYVASHIKTNSNFDWEWTNSTRSNNYINLNFSEPIAIEFEVEPFLRAGGYGNYYRSLLKEKYSGLKRRSFAMANPDMDDDLKGENENESSN